MRKLFYNMTITLVSVVVALVIGGIETLGMVADALHPQGVFWSAVTDLNDNWGLLGYVIIGVFAVSWLASFVVYRVKGYDAVEVRF